MQGDRDTTPTAAATGSTVSGAPRHAVLRPTLADLALPLLVAAAAAAPFHAVLENGFVNWGDAADLVNNPHYRGFTARHLAWMGTTIQMGHFQPLSWLTFAADHALWGMDPRGYHLTSLLLHAACAAAVYYLIRQLLHLSDPATLHRRDAACVAAGLIGALLFAVHPLRVEPVAWATERRGPLSSLFYMAAVGAYLAWAARRAGVPGGAGAAVAATRSTGRRWYVAALACYLLSVLAKEFGVSLPIVLLLLDAWPLRRWRRSRAPDAPALWPLLWEKAPFFLIALVTALVALASAEQSAVAKPLADYGVGQRLAQACFGLIFYLRTALLPLNLSPIYSIPARLNPLDWPYLASAAGVAALALAAWRLRKRLPAVSVTMACCFVILLPVLGLFQTGNQIAADRYTYLPAAAVSVLVAGGLVRLLEVGRRGPRAGAAALAVTAGCGVLAAWWSGLTDAQVRVWKDSRTLWAHALSVDPDCPVANNNMGMLDAEAGRTDEAMQRFQRAIAADPRQAEAMNNLGVMFARQGRMDAAVEQFRAALKVNPRDRDAQTNLERALFGR